MSLVTRRTALAACLILLMGALLLLILTAPRPSDAAVPERLRPAGSLVSFESDADLRAFLQRRAERARSELQTFDAEEAAPPSVMPAPALAAPPPPEEAAAAPDSITNNQEAGVDEGGIVKTYRNMLVILRRGRVFTVSLANGAMRPIASINAFPPGVGGQGDWYDEMLVSGDRVIVIGYSYARGGTEVNRFRITPTGQLSFEDAYHLRSNDYYSSRNYASRLIGDRLVYYTPLYVGGAGSDPLDALPGVSKWRLGAARQTFRRIAQARDVYVTPHLRDDEDAPIGALHSVISCDLTAPELDCDATAVLGPASRSFYVSGNAVYLFVSSLADPKQGTTASYLYRLPFSKDEKPSAIGARGAPVDQFSFREDPQEGRLDVLVRASGGDAMWRPELGEGAVALLQVPLSAFGDGSTEADKSLYRDLPTPEGEGYYFHNRFVGDYLLYGLGSGGSGKGNAVFAASVSRPGAARLPVPHGVDRIEVMGSDALVVGSMGPDLAFTTVTLGGRAPALGSRYIERGTAEGESRSHAFFFNPDAGARDGSGTIALPVAKPVEERYRRFFGTAAAMLFLRREGGRFDPAGELAAKPAGASDDACQASCVDWYGNARPIFLRGRVFALLGYELVEGRLSGGRISEVDRVNFAPRVAALRIGAKP
jgi:hypothetical protein